MKFKYGKQIRFRQPAPPSGAEERPENRRWLGQALIFAVTTTILTAILVGGPVLGQSTAPVMTEAEPPVECVKPSPIAQVTFPHQMHVDDLEIDCVTCHHEVNAGKLTTPHDDYFEDTRVRCDQCHHDQERPIPARACSACHVTSNDTSDQSLSAKVVIHKSCSECHEIGTGAEASASCEFCHSGPNLAW